MVETSDLIDRSQNNFVGWIFFLSHFVNVASFLSSFFPEPNATLQNHPGCGKGGVDLLFVHDQNKQK